MIAANFTGAPPSVTRSLRARRTLSDQEAKVEKEVISEIEAVRKSPEATKLLMRALAERKGGTGSAAPAKPGSH